MRYYFGGSEIKSWRDLLIEQNIPAVSLSYVGLRRRLKKSADNWDMSANYPERQSIFLDSGAYTLNRADSEFTQEQALEIANAYMAFVLTNENSVDLISEFDARVLGTTYINAMREDFYSQLPPEKFMPIWHVDEGTNELDRLCSSYEVVGVTQAEIHDTSLIPTFNSVVNRYGVRLHGVAITSKEMMKAVNWDSVSSMSWLSPSVYGDTIVWTGKELKRYPRAYKDQARKRHRSIFIDNGFNHKKIEADDSAELLKLSLWSWSQFVDSISRRVTPIPREQNEENPEIGGLAVDNHGTEMRNEKLLPALPEQRETTILPLMDIRFNKTNDDEENAVELPFLYKRSESMRVCDTCFLREKCPGFKPNANCLYNIPIEVKTKEQLKAVQEALIEMQTQRVLFMQMAEDLEGGYADPNLSSEMDRLQRMIKAKQDNEKDHFSMTINATQSSNAPSFFAKAFGSQASAKLNELDAPVKADDVIKESEIYDAEVIDG